MAEKATEKVEAPSTSHGAPSATAPSLSSIESDFTKPVKPPRRKNSRSNESSLDDIMMQKNRNIESALDDILMQNSRGVSHQTFKHLHLKLKYMAY